VDTVVNFLADGETQVYAYFAKISAGGHQSQMQSSPATQKVPPLRLEGPVGLCICLGGENLTRISPPTDNQNFQVDVYDRE
jgi:hypothetical protein